MVQVSDCDLYYSDSFSLGKIHKTNGLFERYQYAKTLCAGVDDDRLKAAFLEAVGFLNSGVFPDFMEPHIGVDEYGEVSFSIGNSKGYLDVGFNGTGEISYHIRHDQNPDLTTFGDDGWDGVSPPTSLVESAIEMLHD